MRILFVFLIACFAPLNGFAFSAEDQRVIEYQVGGNEYGVVVVQEEGTNLSQAKQLALKKAAQITQENDFRYFTIEKEDVVRALSTDNPSYSNQPPPHNKYYVMIESENFGRAQFEDQTPAQTGVYPAYRILFKCYAEKPSQEAIDSCTLTPCAD